MQIAPPREYRLLHLEDSPDDAHLVSRALGRAGLSCRIDRADNEPAFLECLAAGLPDAILCDYEMPSFSAEVALHLLAARGLDVPVIIVSNHIDQNAAVIAMQQGASDYLSKRDLGRLGKAIEGAVDRANARREHAAAERALRDSEAMQRAILESLDSRIAVLDSAGVILAANRAWERFDGARLAAGYDAARVGDNYLDLLDAAGRAGHSAAAEAVGEIRRVMARERTFASVDFQLETGASTSWFALRVTPFDARAGGVVLAQQDITDKMMAHLALEGAHRRLQSLSKRVLTIQEDERRAISRELHDDVGQTLAALKIGLHRLAGGAHDAGEARLLAECLEAAEATIDKVRNLAQELRPPQLDTLGLADALRWLAEKQRRVTGVEIACAFLGLDEGRVSASLESACYRIAQEAISNATRHARPRLISISVRRDRALLRLAVSDDGAGFDAEAAQERAVGAGSMGLIGMEERCRLAGGRLKIRSTSGAGTTVTATFPLETRETAAS